MHSKLETYSPKLVAHRTRQSEPDNRLNMHGHLGDTIHRAHGHAYLSHMLFSSLGHGGRGWVVGPPPALRRHRRHLELGHRVLHPLRRTADDGGAHLQPCAGRRGLLRTPHRQHKKVSVVVVAEEEEEEEEKEGGREEEGTLEATRISRAACPDSFAMSTPMILRTGSSSIARSTVVRTRTRGAVSPLERARAGRVGARDAPIAAFASRSSKCSSTLSTRWAAATRVAIAMAAAASLATATAWRLTSGAATSRRATLASRTASAASRRRTWKRSELVVGRRSSASALRFPGILGRV